MAMLVTYHSLYSLYFDLVYILLSILYHVLIYEKAQEVMIHSKSVTGNSLHLGVCVCVCACMCITVFCLIEALVLNIGISSEKEIEAILCVYLCQLFLVLRKKLYTLILERL